MRNITQTMKDQILDWFVNGEKGLSSKAMARCALGQEPLSYDDRFSPGDPADLNRCLKLVKAAPEIKDHFGYISKLSARWAIVIQNWDRLEESFVNEVGWNWCKAKSAPKTFALMQELGI